MAAKSFIDILEDRIRKDLRTERAVDLDPAAGLQDDGAQRRTRSAAETVEAWLIRRMQPVAAAPAVRGYAPGASVRAGFRAAQTPPRRLRLDSVECLLARETFRRLGLRLPEPCTEREVKAAFRKLALRTHPDLCVHAGEAAVREAGEVFARLAEAAGALLRGFRE